MTRLGVNLLWIRPGRVGGTEDFMVRLLLGLHEVDHEFEVTAYAQPAFVQAHPELAHVRFVTAPFDTPNRVLRILLEHTWLAWRTRRDRMDLVHHGGGTIPSFGAAPKVVTIHDLQWQQYPEYVAPAKLRYLKFATPRTVRRARVITTVSEYVKRTVVEAFDVDERRVVVTHHGMEADLGRAGTPESELRAKYGLGDRPVVVYPAMTYPHKRHDFLVDLVAGPWSGITLVLTGAEGGAETKLREKISALGVGDRVVRTGRVSAADRDGLIRMALAVAFPSEYEGFGAPALEAMALGVPLIASDRTALPEVVGDAGVVLPLDPARWADALDIVRARREELIAAGHRRVADFTTRHTALEALRAYRQALS
jgi:alpha-1,3-rhamnosyl/mannosyltransferase